MTTHAGPVAVVAPHHRAPVPDRPSVVRRALPPAAVAACAAAAAVVLHAVSPYEGGTYPTCPVLFLTGFYCPGCGALRAMHDLTHLDLASAWGMNPLVPPTLLLLAALWVGWTRRRLLVLPRSWLAPPAALWTGLVLVVAFGIARNTPLLAPWLAPGGG